MSATSVSGRGAGDSGKLTTTGLAILANGPAIFYSGLAAAETTPTSPPSFAGSVTFARPLPGAVDDYVVLLTTINGGAAYVSHLSESADNFTGFTFVAETECDVMYLVVSSGIRPAVVES